jgi:Tfp pilus assembly protein PilO
MTLNRIRDSLGMSGIAGMFLLALAIFFSHSVVNPLEHRAARLQDKAARKAPAAALPGAEKVAEVYAYLEKDEDTTDWLAKLHGIGMATGVQLKSASYRTQKTDAKIVRTEIALPVAGSYGQIRDFLKRSLAEIPVLSVDQVTLKREARSNLVTAEMRLTLHMVKS